MAGISRICHMTSVHPVWDVRIYLKECRTLASAGYDTHLIAPAPVDQWDTEPCVPGNNVVRIHSMIAPSARSRYQRMAASVIRFARKARSIDARIYHLHDPELIPVGLWLKAFGKKVVYDAHENLPTQILTKHYLPEFVKKPVSVTANAVERMAAFFFDAIVAATPEIAQRFSGTADSVIAVKNYPVEEEFSASGIPETEKENAACYLGGIGLDRGLKQMVEAIGRTRHRLMLAGRFYFPKERDAVSKLPEWNQVDELGFLDRQGVAAVLGRAKVGLVVLQPLQNYIASLPVKMFEYMAAGIPVVASNFPIWRDIIEGNRCGICVDPTRPDDIARAVDWLISHPDEASGMGANGARAIQRKYSWRNEGKKLLDLYHSLER